MKNKKIASTQEHLEVAEIRDGVLILKDGSMRLILLANAINFALKSEAEQNSIIARYQSFLNALTFQIQILMQSRKLDLEKYLQKLKVRQKQETNELIQLQITEYIAYIEKLINIANIMEKRFYVVIPYTPSKVQARSLFDKLLNPTKNAAPSMSESEFKRYKEELIQRANIIAGELGTMGIKVALLNTQQIIELFYSSYNLDDAGSERLVNIKDISSSVV